MSEELPVCKLANIWPVKSYVKKWDYLICMQCGNWNSIRNCSRTKGMGNVVIVWEQAGLWFDGGFNESCTSMPKTPITASAFTLGWHQHKTGRAQRGELGWCYTLHSCHHCSATACPSEPLEEAGHSSPDDAQGIRNQNDAEEEGLKCRKRNI